MRGFGPALRFFRVVAGLQTRLSLFTSRVLGGDRSPPRNLQRDLAHFLVNAPIRRQDDGAAKLIRFSLEIADFAAGFFDEQHTCRNVPLVEVELPETIEAPRSNASQIEGRRAVSPHAVRALRKFAVILKIRAELAVAHRKAGAEQA